MLWNKGGYSTRNTCYIDEFLHSVMNLIADSSHGLRRPPLRISECRVDDSKTGNEGTSLSATRRHENGCRPCGRCANRQESEWQSQINASFPTSLK
jgi:hypothetical protein